MAYLSGDKSPAELHEKGYTGIDYHQNVITSHPEWVEEAHRLGMTVNAWTVNGTEDMMKLCSMGLLLFLRNISRTTNRLTSPHAHDGMRRCFSHAIGLHHKPFRLAEDKKRDKAPLSFHD